MEPVESEVSTWHTTVRSVAKENDEFSFILTGLSVQWFFNEEPNLRPGDRVRITITKETTDANETNPSR